VTSYTRRAELYRYRADEMRTLARDMMLERTRQTLVHMAQEFDTIADDLEAAPDMLIDASPRQRKQRRSAAIGLFPV
jgi:hypothetical protein